LGREARATVAEAADDRSRLAQHGADLIGGHGGHVMDGHARQVSERRKHRRRTVSHRVSWCRQGSMSAGEDVHLACMSWLLTMPPKSFWVIVLVEVKIRPPAAFVAVSEMTPPY